MSFSFKRMKGRFRNSFFALMVKYILMTIAFISWVYSAFGENADEIIGKMAQRSKRVSSFEIGFRQTNELFNETQESSGKVLFKRPRRMRLDWTTAAGGRREVQETFLIEKEANIAWVYLPAKNQVAKVVEPFSSSVQFSQLVEVWFLESPSELMERYDVRLVDTEKSVDGDLYRLELISREDQGKQIWWVDGKIAMRRRVEIYSSDEEIADLTIVFKNYESIGGHWAARRIEMTDLLDNVSVIYLQEVHFNRPIMDKRFIYTLPPGAVLTDAPSLLLRR